ncbi:Uncharacterised protein [Vibrio cholerae]|nr:Uncharacterised protein [Vibrio cholerae]
MHSAADNQCKILRTQPHSPHKLDCQQTLLIAHAYCHRSLGSPRSLAVSWMTKLQYQKQ